MLLADVTHFLVLLTVFVYGLRLLATGIVRTVPVLVAAVKLLLWLEYECADALKKSKLIAALVNLRRFLRDYISLL